MPKKMTIESLAIMIQGEFKNIYERFSHVEAEIASFRQEVNSRFDRIEFNSAAQERRLSILEDKVRMISTKIGLDTRQK